MVRLSTALGTLRSLAALAALPLATAAERAFSFNVTQTPQCGNMTVTWYAHSLERS